MEYNGYGELARRSRAAYRRRRRRRRQKIARLLRTTILVSLSAVTVIVFGREVLAHSRKEARFSWQSVLPITNLPEGNSRELNMVCDGFGASIVPLSSLQGKNSGEYLFSKPVPASVPVERQYFDDAVFIGDSRTEGLLINTGLSNAVFYVHKGLMVDTVFTEPVINKDGQKLSVMDALRETKFSKVYVMFGVNETGWVYSELFQKKYGDIIDTIREINPMATIYIQSILPVSEKVSSTHSYITNEKINQYNELLQELAEEKQVYYLDIRSAVADKSGSLPEDAAIDGIHLVKEYCIKWLDYLQSHTIK